MTYSAAKQYCEDGAGHLVYINNPVEDYFLKSQFSGRGTMWLGTLPGACDGKQSLVNTEVPRLL